MRLRLKDRIGVFWEGGDGFCFSFCFSLLATLKEARIRLPFDICKHCVEHGSHALHLAPLDGLQRGFVVLYIN